VILEKLFFAKNLIPPLTLIGTGRICIIANRLNLQYNH
jgi:hypothetical protein